MTKLNMFVGGFCIAMGLVGLIEGILILAIINFLLGATNVKFGLNQSKGEKGNDN